MKTEKEAEVFSERLRRLREARRLTQRELGALAGIDPARVSRYESGSLAEPRVATVTRLARALDVSPTALRGDPGTRPDVAELEPVIRQVRRVWGRAGSRRQREIENELRRIAHGEERD